MRVLIFGFYKAERLVDALAARGATTITVASSIDPLVQNTAADVRWEPLIADPDVARICDLVRRTVPDVVVTTVFAEEEEHLVLRYSRALEGCLSPDRRRTVHPERFALLAVDKVAFHEFAMSCGLAVPRGRVCQSPREVSLAVQQLGGPPVVIKQACAQALHGVDYLADGQAVSQWLDLDRSFPVLVQEAIRGEELGVEVVSTETRSCRCPVISTGRLDASCRPAGRVRCIPYPLPLAAAEDLEHVVGTIERVLRPRGAWQLDLALDDEGRLLVIELNGRLGGLSDLCRDATSTDPYGLLCDAALGLPLHQPRPQSVVVHVPMRRGARPADVRIVGVTAAVAGSQRTDPGFDRATSSRLIVRASSRRQFLHWLSQQPAEPLLTTRDVVARQVGRAFDELETAGTDGA